ncbi:hypothetical protein BDP55DRAFT_626864 [Colletotrichum godetiae]|uniref:Uncharacterized protein n=1 Tax=Colletotrichum godetiae TaxID=1209918 RepID=A0AAJ0AWL0_9PEZI|nr:uncharacterized protein BDP55DRAFT_626864 [Colletotrichum godetiae]KAK1691178.1 hypothetical protein BDP55DRAFT_626864 [Colletotrichum godetiae]
MPIGYPGRTQSTAPADGLGFAWRPTDTLPCALAFALPHRCTVPSPFSLRLENGTGLRPYLRSSENAVRLALGPALRTRPSYCETRLGSWPELKCGLRSSIRTEIYPAYLAVIAMDTVTLTAGPPYELWKGSFGPLTLRTPSPAPACLVNSAALLLHYLRL